MSQFDRPPQPPPQESPEARQVSLRHTARVRGKLYDAHKLIDAAENLPVEVVPISTFDELKGEAACWTDKEGNRLGPKQLLELAEEYSGDFNAMLLAKPEWEQHIVSLRDADYKTYPLLVEGDHNVIDGMHRLTRAWIDKAKEIKIKRFDKLPAEAETQDNV